MAQTLRVPNVFAGSPFKQSPGAKRRATKKPAPKRYGAVGRGADTTHTSTPRQVVAPDRADERRALRERQLERSVPKTPDQADRKRSPAQRSRDAKVVARNVRDSRLKAQSKRHVTVKDILHTLAAPVRAGIRVQQGDTVAVSADKARELRKQGKTVRTIRSGDVGATIGVKTIGNSGVTRAAQATALGIYKDPKTSIPATLKGLRDMATGAPAAVVKLATDPKGTVKSTVKDYKRRYGGINDPGGVDRMADRISKEGAAAELMDFASIGVPAGKVTDLALAKAARAGRLGDRLREATTKERPDIRTTGGESRKQKRSKGLVGALRENRKDRQAGEAVAREVSTADAAARRQRVKDAGNDTAAVRTDGNWHKGEVDAVVREAHERGEIVPTRRSRPGRRVVSQRQLEKAQRRAYAGEKGRALHRQRAEQREEIAHGANKTVASLNPHEQRAFKLAMQTGATTPAEGVKVAKRRIAMINETRRAGRDTDNIDVDELPTLETIVNDPHRHFTPRLERAVRIEMERGARVGEGDPSLGRTATERAETAETRRLAPQADTLGVTRGGTPIDQAIKSGDRTVREARKLKDRARAVHAQAEQRAAAAQGYAASGARRASAALGHRRIKQADGTVIDGKGPIGRAERAAEAHENAAKNWEHKAARARSAEKRADYELRAGRAYERATAARGRLESLEGGKAATRPEYRRAVQRARSRADNARRELDRRNEDVRAAGAAARSLRRSKNKGVKLLNAEPMRDFHGRTRAAAKQAGLGEPGFFPSVRRSQTKFSPFTIGGARRAKPDAGYKGKLFRAGRESNSPVDYTQALAKNIKRKHNWKLVADTIDAHAFSWGKGVKYGQARDLLARRGIDPDSVRIIDMDAFDGAASRAAEDVDARPADHLLDAELHNAFKDSVVDIDRAAELEPGAGRLLIMPKHVAEEIMSDTKPSGVLGRGLDIAKGKQARVMLGLSPAWLQFQVAANVIQTGMATLSLPGEWVYANVKWYRGLKDSERKALEPYIGVGAFHDSLDTPKMGAAAQGGLVNAYRAFKAHDFWHKPRRKAGGRAISQLNPLDTLFRLDNAQNNFFRKAVLYNRLKREAFDRMGTNMANHQRLMGKLIGKVGEDPQAMIRSLIHDRDALEEAATSVKDFLGDYMTYTAKERKILSRNIMFYGYLRFSLRFTFYTMPVKHPVMTSILAQMGGVNAREVKELLGGDELPWALGKLYFTRDGKLKEIDLSRANPFMNAVTQAKIPEKGAVRGLLQSAVGFLPPMIGSAANIAFAKSLYKDRAYKVNGESTARPNKEGQAITDADALQIFTKEMLGLTALYRLEEKARADGRPISDDSIIGINENYTEYKDPKLKTDTARAERETSPGRIRAQQLLPLVPRPSRDVETAAKIRRARGETATPGSAPATASGPADDETSKLFDAYSDTSAAATPDIEELTKLLSAYGAGG